MIFDMPLCIFWATEIAASSILDRLGQPVVAATSSQPKLARPFIHARTVGLRKRGEVCFADTTSWYDMVKAYSGNHQQILDRSLTAALKESEMTLTGKLTLASSQNDPNRVFCDIFPEASGESGTSFPRCLLETAINDFCTVSQDLWINSTSPSSTDSKGGRWKTYKFTGYSISGLYVGLEFSKVP